MSPVWPLLLATVALGACDPRNPATHPTDAAAPAVASVLAPPSTLDAGSTDSALAQDAGAPYDLSADLAARAASARALFPASSFPSYATRIEGSVYLLVSPQGQAMLSAGAFQLRRALAFYYDGHSTPGDPSSPPPFTRHADHAVSVYLFATRAAFLDFALRHEGVDAGPPRELLGFFLPDGGDMVISGQGGLGTMTHEMIHPIVAADAPGLPRWMNECLGSTFEQPVFSPDGSMHGASNRRYIVLQQALVADAGSTPSLEALFGMSNHEFVGGSPLTPEGTVDARAKAGAELLHYASARSFCQWLDSKHHKLWAFYHAWRDAFATDRTGEAAFRATMGGDPAALDGDWRAWVDAQPR